MVKKRFIILDEADSLTTDAQKALRQIMEESHATTVFILTGNEVGAFHKAVKDRCSVYQFGMHDAEDVEKVCLMIHEAESLPDEWKQYYRTLSQTSEGSLRSVVDTLQSTAKQPEALLQGIKGRGENLSKAALNLAGGDFNSMCAYLTRELEEGGTRIGTLKRLRYRVRPLLEQGEEWYAFMETYGDMAMIATQWPDDDISFFEYFVAKMKKNINRKGE